MRVRAWWVVVLLAAVACPVYSQQCADKLSAAELDRRIDAVIAQMTPKERTAQLQDRAPGIPRLGIAGYNWWNEGLHGVARNGYATVFPQAIGLAATFDTELLHSVGEVVSTEARAKYRSDGESGSPRYGGLTLWSPNINIFRDPRWGRGQETYGEDPTLTSALGQAFVSGVQGDDGFYLRADATPKHFAAHSGPEAGRDSFNARVSEHDLEDTYLPAFHALLTHGAAAMMCSYNEINGVPACANRALLQGRVRDAWKFDGYIVSDCGAVGNIFEYHHYAVSAAAGAAAALSAGVDLGCGSGYEALDDAEQQGLITDAQVRASLHRLLLARVRLGAVALPETQDCSPYRGIPADANDTMEHRALALRAAEESIVLLKNDGTLPLRRTARVAVIGPDADLLSVLEANYHGTASRPMTPLQGMRGMFGSVAYAQGSTLVDGLPIVVPETALRTGSGADSQPGLKLELFARTDFSGAPALTTEARTLDADLDRVTPDPRFTAKAFSARWSGYLVPPAPGDYVLRLRVERCWDCTAHDRYRVRVAGQEISGGESADVPAITVHAADTRPLAVSVELRHTGDDEGVHLEWLPPAGALQQQALRTAGDADAVVAVLGLSPELEGEALSLDVPGFHGGDRTSLALPAAQLRLLDALRSTGKPVIVVLCSGSAVSLAPEAANALLEAWYPGEEGGTAIAAVLSGEVSPSGKLPVTVYRSADDLPAFDDYSMRDRTYRYHAGPVLYPFGAGGSYADFLYEDARPAKVKVRAGEPVAVTVTVRNASGVAGDAVVEAYVVPPVKPGAPRAALVAFRRVTLAAGEKKAVAMEIPAGFAGRYRVWVGGGLPGSGGGFWLVVGR